MRNVAAMSVLLWVIAAAIVVRWLAQLGLSGLNAAHVRRHRGEIPAAYRDMVDAETYAKSVDYTLAKSHFGRIEDTWDAIVLAVVLFSGVLPAAWSWWTGWAGESALAGAGFLAAFMMVLSVPGLPFEWWAQFRLEERFGFNKSTLGLWVMDHIKGAILGLVIGVPLVWLLLALVGWIGSAWWVWAWAVFFGFQLILMVLYPMLILPLFNKLTPLPEGESRDRLLGLARQASFKAASVQVMDGSKRSGHSNAFFTGFGRFRRIVLFDTLIEQLQQAELEGVLAHEIGHYKLGHIPRMLLVSAATTLAAFGVVGSLARMPAFFSAFGFAQGHVAIAFLIFAFAGGVFTFWLGPLAHLMSRRHEYQADAYAAKLTGAAGDLVAALRKLATKNLSNLTPHPVFSAFYYSHPTLAEREAALTGKG